VGAVFSADLTRVLERVAAQAGVVVSDKSDRDSSMRALFRWDYLPFLQKGIPAVWILGGFHPGYHEPADPIERLDCCKVSRADTLTMDAARAPGSAAPPPRLGPPSPGAVRQWQAPAGPPLP